MSRKPESNFRDRVRRDLQALPNTVLFPIQQVSIGGDPDFLLCVRGFFVALELKSTGGKVSPLQEHKLQAVVKAGGTSLVAFPKNWKQVYKFIFDLANNKSAIF